MKKISILGSTGSIGTQALDLIAKTKNEFKVLGLAAGSNIDLVKKQISQFKPLFVSVFEKENADKLQKWCISKKYKTKILFGKDGLIKIATIKGAEMVLSAVVGAVGLAPLLAAIDSGKNVALANKESLVMAGSLIMKRAKEKNVAILPVDSEHSAIFQCIGKENKKSIKRILLTASGGPFYRSNKNFADITVEDALAHPTWKMGKKITVDSATLMNKGLEAIEASVLFDVPIDKIDILIHPQSIVHSMVEFTDGCVMAQLSNPDMTLPIQYALYYPDRKDCYIKRLDLAQAAKLEFFNPDFKKFKCLDIAYRCAKIGGTMLAVMSAANEVAVRYFLNGKIKFNMIPEIVEKVIKRHKVVKTKNINKFIEADKWAREIAESISQEIGRSEAQKVRGEEQR